MKTGMKVLKGLGLEKFPNVEVARVLVSTFKIYVVFYDSKMRTRPITNTEVRRMQYFLPGMQFPFKDKPSLLPLISLRDFNGPLRQAMFFVVDLAGKYSDGRHLDKKFESIEPVFTGKLHELVSFSDLNRADVTSDLTNRTRADRNREVGAENRTAKLVDVTIDTVEDHVTFIFKTTATTPLYPQNYDFKKTDPDTFNLQRNPDKEYELHLRVVDFFKWLKGTKPDASTITAQDVKDVIDINPVQVFSTSPSFHWQGFNWWMSQLDGSIYPTSIRPQSWNQIHGDGEAFLDKHLYGLIRQINFFHNPMASMLTKRLRDRGDI